MSGGCQISRIGGLVEKLTGTVLELIVIDSGFGTSVTIYMSFRGKEVLIYKCGGNECKHKREIFVHFCRHLECNMAQRHCTLIDITSTRRPSPQMTLKSFSARLLIRDEEE